MQPHAETTNESGLFLKKKASISMRWREKTRGWMIGCVFWCQVDFEEITPLS